jgi:hypothetical protein
VVLRSGGRVPVTLVESSALPACLTRCHPDAART